MHIIAWIREELEELLAAASVTLEGDTGTRVSVWGSWSPCEPRPLQQLQEAGCQEVILNVNTVDGAGKKWVWQNGRGAVLDRAQRVIEAGMTVAWMPWCWAYEDWGTMAGKALAELDADLRARTGQGARMVQLDWEGHAEVSAKRLAAAGGGSIEAVVDRCLTALCRELPGEVELGITPLYFRRPGGDAAIRWSREIDGRLWSVRELLTQAYSVWLAGNSAKAQATHAPEYQPGILQRRAWDNYAPFAPYLDEVGIGLNGWALQRTGAGVPDALEMSAEEAMDRAVEACMELGVARVAFWALHLFDSGSRTERARFELVLEAIRRLRGTGGRVLPEARTPDPEPEPHTGLEIHWERRRLEERLARGGAPAGYVLPGRRGVPLGQVTPMARQVLARAKREGWELGTIVPATLLGRRFEVAVQLHPWTLRGGKRVPYNGAGATVFVEA